jgi:hypothetical protein
LICITCLSAILFILSNAFSSIVTVYNESKAYNGYTLFSPFDENSVMLIDMQGNRRHFWSSSNPRDESPKPILKGNILDYISMSTSSIASGIAEIDWNGNVLFSFFSEEHSFLHHDQEKTRKGNYMILGSKFHTIPSISPSTLQDDFIIEVDLHGNIIWEWMTSDHFDEFGFSEEAKRIIWEGTPYDENHVDVFHTNSIQVIPENRFYNQGDNRFRPGNILVSQRNTNIVFVIDKNSGKIVWKVGPEDNVSIGQHHASMIRKGYPGAGNILLFDNGGEGGYPQRYRSTSRIIEINRDKEIEWLYTARNFSNSYMGSAQRLPNGNTMICEAVKGRIFEVTMTGEIVWEYLHTDPNQEHDSKSIYRAYRVGLDWPSE